MRIKEEKFNRNLTIGAVGTLLGVLLVLVVLVLVKSNVSVVNKPIVKKTPTKEDIKRWERQYEEYGDSDPDIDISVQYGGR